MRNRMPRSEAPPIMAAFVLGSRGCFSGPGGGRIGPLEGVSGPVRRGGGGVMTAGALDPSDVVAPEETAPACGPALSRNGGGAFSTASQCGHGMRSPMNFGSETIRCPHAGHVKEYLSLSFIMGLSPCNACISRRFPWPVASALSRHLWYVAPTPSVAPCSSVSALASWDGKRS